MIDDDDDKKKEYGQKGKQQGQPGKPNQGSQGRPATRFMDRPGSEHPENQPESSKPSEEDTGVAGTSEEAGQDYGQQGTAKHVQPREKGKQGQGKEDPNQGQEDEKTGA